MAKERSYAIHRKPRAGGNQDQTHRRQPLFQDFSRTEIDKRQRRRQDQGPDIPVLPRRGKDAMTKGHGAPGGQDDPCDARLKAPQH